MCWGKMHLAQRKRLSNARVDDEKSRGSSEAGRPIHICAANKDSAEPPSHSRIGNSMPTGASQQAKGEISAAVQREWENREFVQTVSLSVKALADFISDFGA